MTLAEQIVASARSYAGVEEDPRGSNRGPLIDHWNAFCGASQGDPWCAAFVCAVVHEARVFMRMQPLTLLVSASAMGLLKRNAALVVDSPMPGDLVVFDHGGGKGHVAIVTGPGTSIAGNTSPDGTSREGYGVFEHAYDPNDPKIAGYIGVS